MCLTRGRKSVPNRDSLNVCASASGEEYDMIPAMIDPGASDTMASSDHFTDYPLVQTTASGVDGVRHATLPRRVRRMLLIALVVNTLYIGMHRFMLMDRRDRMMD